MIIKEEDFLKQECLGCGRIRLQHTDLIFCDLSREIRGEFK